MKKRIKYIIYWSIFLAYIITAFSFVNSKVSDERCNKLNITIVDKNQHYFIDKKDVENILIKHNTNIIGTKKDSIILNKIESSLLSNPSVLKGEVYFSDHNELNIEVIQRNPIIRVISDNLSIYIDETGTIIPLSDNYSARVIVATINQNIDLSRIKIGKNINLYNDSIKIEKLMNEIFTLSKYIYNDNFWNAQITQINIDSNNEIELIPRIGEHIIVFGNIENYEKKFQQIKTLYLKGFNNIGWSEYKEINLKYNNQIVCKKRNNYDTGN